VDEKGIDRGSGKVLVEVDPRYFRPTDVDCLIGDAGKAHYNLVGVSGDVRRTCA